MALVTCSLNTLVYDPVRCAGCGMCTLVCPHGVFSMVGRKAAVVGAERCIECGACAMNCPARAIQVSAGVGCAAAMIHAALTGGPVSCGPSCRPECGPGCGSRGGAACC